MEVLSGSMGNYWNNYSTCNYLQLRASFCMSKFYMTKDTHIPVSN